MPHGVLLVESLVEIISRLYLTVGISSQAWPISLMDATI